MRMLSSMELKEGGSYISKQDQVYTDPVGKSLLLVKGTRVILECVSCGSYISLYEHEDAFEKAFFSDLEVSINRASGYVPIEQFRALFEEVEHG